MCIDGILLLKFLFFSVSCIHHNSSQSNDLKVTRKEISVQAWRGPEGSRKLRLPDFMTTGTLRWQRCQPYVAATFTAQEIFLVLISVGGESIPARGEITSMKISMSPSGIEPAIYRLVAQCRIYMYIYKHNSFIHLFQGIYVPDNLFPHLYDYQSKFFGTFLTLLRKVKWKPFFPLA